MLDRPETNHAPLLSIQHPLIIYRGRIGIIDRKYYSHCGKTIPVGRDHNDAISERPSVTVRLLLVPLVEALLQGPEDSEADSPWVLVLTLELH